MLIILESTWIFSTVHVKYHFLSSAEHSYIHFNQKKGHTKTSGTFTIALAIDIPTAASEDFKNNLPIFMTKTR